MRMLLLLKKIQKEVQEEAVKDKRRNKTKWFKKRINPSKKSIYLVRTQINSQKKITKKDNQMKAKERSFSIKRSQKIYLLKNGET